MIPALIIAAVVAGIGIILYIFELRWRRRHGESHGEPNVIESGIEDEKSEGGKVSAESEKEENVSEDRVRINREEENQEECCGLHLVCEKDSLSPMSAEIIYYDDEELDRFIGRSPESYSAEEEEEFRDVLMTLRPEDVNGWARSITQRRLELPSDVRDELLMLVNEQRNSH